MRLALRLAVSLRRLLLALASSNFLPVEDDEQRHSPTEEHGPDESEQVPAGGGGTVQSYPSPSPMSGRDPP